MAPVQTVYWSAGNKKNKCGGAPPSGYISLSINIAGSLRLNPNISCKTTLE